MKRLFMIGGPMGVGKTTTCQLLKEKLNNAVFLDGVWCWDASPFQVTEETKKMVLENICFLLNQFLHCSAYENVIFCRVMHKQSILDEILEHLDLSECEVKCISLICTKQALMKRLQADADEGIITADVIEHSLQRLPLYSCLKTMKVDVSNLTAADAADTILAL